MASSISLEYLLSIEGVANGLATLDSSGLIPAAQIPPAAMDVFKGEYATESDLTTAFPTGSIAQYAYVDATSSFWYWNGKLATPAWVNQLVTSTDYLALTAAQQSVVPYIIIPG